MSFDKHYPNRKDWRKPYTKSKRFDRSCRCHGGCDYCRNNRLAADKRRLEDAEERMKVLLNQPYSEN